MALEARLVQPDLLFQIRLLPFPVLLSLLVCLLHRGQVRLRGLGLGCKGFVFCSGCRVQGSGCRVQGLGFRVRRVLNRGQARLHRLGFQRVGSGFECAALRHFFSFSLLSLQVLEGPWALS